MTPDPPPATLPAATPALARRHDLDALRGAAMLLGILLHAALSFVDVPWPVQDVERVPALGIVLAWIHGFRMQLFFLISGFFTAMLWRRRGLGGLVRHRAMRIALPLAIGCLTIVPLMWGLVVAAAIMSPSPGSAPDAERGRDIWTAAAWGRVADIERHVASGSSPDAVDPVFGLTPLGWAAATGQPDSVDALLAAGAEADGRARDGSTPLQTAAFFGQAASASRLLDAGADPTVRNDSGENARDVMVHDRSTTGFIAGLLRISIDWTAVEAGRAAIAVELDAAAPAADGTSPAVTAEPDGPSGNTWRDLAGVILTGLMTFPLFHHLWFLWFLLWMVAGFVVVVAIASRIPGVRHSGAWGLLALVPGTLAMQWFMNAGGTMPGFGPDTSAGLLPMPHVLAYHGAFFAAGALLFRGDGPGGLASGGLAPDGLAPRAGRLAAAWPISLLAASAIFFPALLLSGEPGWAESLLPTGHVRHAVSCLGQVSFAWLMVHGVLGLGRRVLARERRWVRYMSDASYWMYLAHLPIVLGGQMLLRNAAMPAAAKLTIIIVGTTALLLVSYAIAVRPTWLGRLLNGPRRS